MELPPPQGKEQGAKVHEHVVATARELEEATRQLAAGSAASRHKFLSLAEKIKTLQASTRQLQAQVEELKSLGQGRRGPGKRGPTPAPGSGGGKELREHDDLEAAGKVASWPGPPSLYYTEENKHLKKLLRTLRARLSLEQQRRGALEEQLGLVLRKNEELEQQLGAARGYRARALELEAAVAEIRRVLRLERPLVVEKLVHGSLLVLFREPGQSLREEVPMLTVPEAQRRPLRRPLQPSSSSETMHSSSVAGGDIGKSHEGTCLPKTKAVEQSSRLQELGAQYEELLTKCKQQMGDSLSHRAGQAARAPARAGASTSTPLPKYKVLFKEIFSCVQKRTQVGKQRGNYRSLPSP
ncbi:cerebellar degeneration-related protein 2-like [Pipistrellus kuhlii]|uniref:cerebellar degeneration-related protein 2-like n=1 Tax=Pipistrellus kuhlii TaxID=59472 RepID=UPI00174F6CBD|nr:cerebellar degeneration-related protein 2-like [Pipistrellus kuhlii]